MAGGTSYPVRERPSWLYTSDYILTTYLTTYLTTSENGLDGSVTYDYILFEGLYYLFLYIYFFPALYSIACNLYAYNRFYGARWLAGTVKPCYMITCSQNVRQPDILATCGYMWLHVGYMLGYIEDQPARPGYMWLHTF